ncbi:19072_t:CDS:2, partial [Gigaspora margarita]
FKRSDDFYKQKETETQLNVINEIYEQLTKGDFVNSYVIDELNTKFEYERQCLKNELRLKDEEKCKETKELKSRITELERQNKEINLSPPDHLNFLKREFKRSDDFYKQKETETQLNVINEIYEQLTKGDFVNSYVIDELNTKFEYERQCLKNELRLKDEEKCKETKELKSRITELERQNKEIKDMLALRVDINGPELISLKSRCEELTEQVSIFSNNMD